MCDFHIDAGDEVDVIAINKSDRFAVLSDGNVAPVTHWFGSRGDECDPMEALSCVVGSNDLGWFVIDLLSFDYATVH